MQKTSKNILESGVKILKNLGFSPDNIIVTGSVALDIQGVLPEYRTVHDLDFIIKMDDKTWGYLKLFGAIHEYDNDKYSDCKKERVDFILNGIKFNIWRDTKDAKTCYDIRLKDENTGVWVSPVKNIIWKKKSYGRSKDYKDISDICKNIL